MISADLRHLAEWCARHAAGIDGAANQFAVLGLAAHLDDLVERAEALERVAIPAHARLVELPAGVIDLAAFRRARPPTPHDGGHAA